MLRQLAQQQVYTGDTEVQPATHPRFSPTIALFVGFGECGVIRLHYNRLRWTSCRCGVICNGSVWMPSYPKLAYPLRDSRVLGTSSLSATLRKLASAC
ncbi:hypothetical protein BOTBODRAFT_246339 [Botryobasidium botryosum FD-172 SS1]|uniref:Uncharacterized protein n=1 Tax=Botryobasidium botryosum (strain FD-172 SS1) TaxID=930990 RepID=A0A067LU08_BOTB1|nr:hypothetical protein BOTBODRAFT_246339 [Botryobasidium botryosum FD-172 SS1]